MSVALPKRIELPSKHWDSPEFLTWCDSSLELLATTLRSNPYKLDDIDSRSAESALGAHSLLDLGSDMLLCGEATQRRGEVFVKVGYPFPVARRSISIDRKSPVGSVSLHLHLSSVDEACMQELQRQLRACESRIIVKHLTSKKFRDVSRNILSEFCFQRLLYIDPFDFLGDSIQHLRNRDSFLAFTRISNILSLTRNETLSQWDGFNLYDGNIASFVRHDTEPLLTVVPNYIDNQWQILSQVAGVLISVHSPFALFVPGRRLIIRRRMNRGPLELSVALEKCLNLWQAPVETMLAKELDAFGVGSDQFDRATTLERSFATRVVVFPFTSTRLKDLQSSVLRGLSLSAVLSPHVELIVIVRQSDMERAVSWTNEADALGATVLALDGMRAVSDFLLSTDIVVAADTYITHLCVRLGVRVVTLYNSCQWDGSHHGSLLHHSVLGFASRVNTAIPLVASWTPITLKNIGMEDEDTRVTQATEFLARGAGDLPIDYKISASLRARIQAALESGDANNLITEFVDCQSELRISALIPNLEWVYKWDCGIISHAILNLKCNKWIRWRLAQQLVFVSPLWKFISTRES